MPVFGRGHDLEHVERGPGHVVAEHFEVGQLHEGRRLEVHVVCADFLAAFLDRVGDVLALGALVGAQAPDEVIEGFFEPGPALLRCLARSVVSNVSHMFAAPQRASRNRLPGYIGSDGGVGGRSRGDPAGLITGRSPWVGWAKEGSIV